MTTVTLPRDVDPVFPEKCVRCGDPPAGARARFVHYNGSRFFLIRVPICPPCRPRLVAWLVWNNLRTLLIGGAALTFGLVVLLPRLPGWATGLIVLGLCILGFAAVFAWNLRHPPAFNVDAGLARVDYEFRSDGLGREFALLNGMGQATDAGNGGLVSTEEQGES